MPDDEPACSHDRCEHVHPAPAGGAPGADAHSHVGDCRAASAGGGAAHEVCQHGHPGVNHRHAHGHTHGSSGHTQPSSSSCCAAHHGSSGDGDSDSDSGAANAAAVQCSSGRACQHAAPHPPGHGCGKLHDSSAHVCQHSSPHPLGSGCGKHHHSPSDACIPACRHDGRRDASGASACCAHTHVALEMASLAPEGAARAAAAAAAAAPSKRPARLRGAREVTTTVHAAGICCPMESRVIHATLGTLPGVRRVDVAVVTKTVRVDHDPSLVDAATLVAALNRAGLQARLMGSRGGGAHAGGGGGKRGGADAAPDVRRCTVAGCAGGHAAAAGAGAAAGDAGGLHSRSGWMPPWGILLCGALQAVSLVSLVPGLPPVAADVLAAFGAAAAVVAVPPVARKAWGAARAATLDINALVLVAMVGALALGQLVEAGAIMLLFTLSEWLEERCMGRAAGALTAIAQLQPEHALLLPPRRASACGEGAACGGGGCGGGGGGGDGGVAADDAARRADADAAQQPTPPPLVAGASGARLVPVEALVPGDLVLVRPGEKVPADGLLMDARGVLDESMLTGESRPVTKVPGDALMGGTINAGAAPLALAVSTAAADSAVARLAAMVEAAAASKSRGERAVEAFARWYTPATLLAAAALLVVLLCLDVSQWRRALYLSLVVLVTACPCALVISTPVASAAGLARAAGQGVLIKGGRFLELLGQVRCVTFDKSGTLTEGSFQLLHSEDLGGGDGVWGPNDPLRWAAALEAHSTHPLAPAIVACARRAQHTGAGAVPSAADVQVVTGRGVSGLVEGRRVAVGSPAWAAELVAAAAQAAAGGARPQNALARVHALARAWGQAHGASPVVVVVDGAPASVLLLADTVREEAREALGELAAMRVAPAMLTGDAADPATAVAQQLGLPADAVHAQLMPQDKLQLLTTFRGRHGCVAHVGDGSNDAPALAAADVGVAMGVGGAALAVQSADVALFTNDLRALPFALRLGRAVGRNVAANIVFAVAVKAVVLGAAAGGFASLWLSLAADVGASLAVTLHALTLLGFERRLGGPGGLRGALAAGWGRPAYRELEDAEVGAGEGADAANPQRAPAAAHPHIC